MTPVPEMRWHLPHRPATRMAAAVIAVSLALAACAPSLERRPSVTAPGALASKESLRATAGEWPEDKWWQAFGDDQLDTLIDEALRDSPDLRVMAARVRRADALAVEAGAVQRPGVEVIASAGGERSSVNTGVAPTFKPFLPSGWFSTGRAAIEVDQALDFFGRNRAAIAAATSDAEVQRIELAAARIEIAAAVAEAYGEFVRLAAERQATADALRIRHDTADLVGRRMREGLENSGRAAQANAAEASARVDLVVVERAIALVRNRIAALLGGGPDRGLALTLPPDVTVQPLGLPPTAGIALVSRRTDLVAARLRLQAAAHRIAAERAGFYPDVRLRALIGFKSIPIDRLVESESIDGEVGPALTLPLFKSRGSLDAAAARYDELVAEYDRTLVQSLREVADAIVDQRALADALEQAGVALSASEEAYSVARRRYTGGLASYLDVLTVETDMLTQRRRVSTLKAQRMLTDVQLIRALGGGFVESMPAASGAAQ